MTYGLSPNDVADGFRACVREDLFGDLKKYLPEKEQSLDNSIAAAAAQRGTDKAGKLDIDLSHFL